jgi:hypothetical protein
MNDPQRGHCQLREQSLDAFGLGQVRLFKVKSMRCQGGEEGLDGPALGILLQGAAVESLADGQQPVIVLQASGVPGDRPLLPIRVDQRRPAGNVCGLAARPTSASWRCALLGSATWLDGVCHCALHIASRGLSRPLRRYARAHAYPRRSALACILALHGRQRSSSTSRTRCMTPCSHGNAPDWRSLMAGGTIKHPDAVGDRSDPWD